MTTPHTTPAAILPELLDLIRFQQEYIVAIPSDVAASLPAMPGFDGDWAVDLVERAKALAASAPKADHIEDDLAMAPAPLQQGEYLPLPECDATTIGLGQVWNRHSMHAYVDADRAARGQALRLLTQKEKDSLGRRAEGMDGNEWDQWVQEKFAQVNGLRVQGGSYEWDWE